LVSGKPTLLCCTAAWAQGSTSTDTEQQRNAKMWEELGCGRLWFADNELVDNQVITGDAGKEHARRLALHQQSGRLAEGVADFETNLQRYQGPAKKLTDDLNSPETKAHQQAEWREVLELMQSSDQRHK
jgi:hypothetical protein